MLLALLAAATHPVDTPKAFIQQLYANYGNSSYSPFNQANRVFAPRLLAAINEDSKLAHGEVGYLDGDPICQCQDTAGLHASVKSVVEKVRDKATVTVKLDFQDSTPTKVRFSLIRTAAGWRIADVSASDEPSLLKALEDSNRRAGKH